MTTEQNNQPVRKFGLLNIILLLGLGILLFGEAKHGYQLQKLCEEREQVNHDYAVVNSITFGVFSIDKWRDRMGDILDQKVDNLNMSAAQKRALQVQVEQQFNQIITTALANINKPQKSFMGRIKKLAVNKFVDEDKIRALVPAFAKTVVDKVSSPSSTARLKNIVSSKVHELEAQTYDSTTAATAAVDAYMYHKYKVADSTQFQNVVHSTLASISVASYDNLYLMLGCALVALILLLLMRKMVHLQATLLFMSLLFALVLLAVGITSSIIEVDAQLTTFNFSLAGHNIAFNNQDLFFQSKSILEIIQTMIKQPKMDAVIVGFLMMLFVIILPLIRIIAKGIHILGGKAIAENKAVVYMAFNAAKWDMADVMVVAILMTYIGMNGILRSELMEIEFHNSTLSTTTGNYTSLQPGYFAFIGYVVFAIVLAAVLNRISPRDGVVKKNV